MDITTMATTTTTPTTGKPPPVEAESETPPAKMHPIKPISFNGVLKFHAPPTGCFAYKECLKNHAASMGGHALDGCGEFMPAATSIAADPTSLKCAACGCHRNFHRREPEDPPPRAAVSPIIEYRPHHRHHPPPPTSAHGSQSPPPISSAYYPGSTSAPHMLLALSEPNRVGSGSNSNRKRYRTKFTQEQKVKMQEFAEKVGWKMQKSSEDSMKRFCSEIGVERGVFKVWMHNNKNTLSKRSDPSERNGNRNGDGNGDRNSHSSSIEQQDHHPLQYNGKSNAPNNGSSSSS